MALDCREENLDIEARWVVSAADADAEGSHKGVAGNTERSLSRSLVLDISHDMLTSEWFTRVTA